MQNTLSDLKNNIEKLIVRGNTDQALSLLCQYTHDLTRNGQAPGKIFGSPLLDSLCQSIGKNILDGKSGSSQPAATASNGKSGILFLVTELYAIGGHSGVIEDLIDSYGKASEKSTILFTDTFGTLNRKLVQQRYGHKAELLFKPNGWSHSQTVMWIHDQVQQLKPAKTFLFNHMDDAIAVAAAQPNLPTELYFFHHCDHTFTLGLHLDHCRHLDFRQSGFWNCRQQLGKPGNRYIPLTSSNHSLRSSAGFLKDGKPVTCTSGSPAKFSQPYEYSLAELIPQILSATGGQHIHIGQLDSQTIRKTLSLMEESGIKPERWIRIPYVESLSATLRERQVDIYLDSFAICGCKAVVEAMGAGIPVIVHKNYRSRLLSNVDLIYPEAFAWSAPSELVAKLPQYTKAQLELESNAAYTHFSKHHHPEVLSNHCEALAHPEETPHYSLQPYPNDDARAFVDELELVNERNKAERKMNQKYRDVVDLIETVYPLFSTDMTMDKAAMSHMLYRLVSEETSTPTGSAAKMRLAKVRHKIQSLLGLS